MRRWPNACGRSCWGSRPPTTCAPRASGGKPVDPVARFHLGNGARLERLNWLGDTSPKGLREAHGLMVNYLYDLRFIEANHEAFANDGTVVAAEGRPATPARDPACPGDRRMNENLFEIFRRSFPADLGRVFLERPDGSVLSYADLLDLSGRVAQVLQDLGVKPGDRVAAQVEKSAEALMVYLGALRAGAVYLPLNTAYTAGEIRYFLGDAEPTLFVCRPELQEQMAALGRELGVPHVLDAGRARRRQLVGQGAGRRGRRCRRAAQQGRPRGLPLHLGHHRAAPRAPCSATATSPPTPRPCAMPGGSPPTTGCCTRCRSSTPTACSSPPTSP